MSIVTHFRSNRRWNVSPGCSDLLAVTAELSAAPQRVEGIVFSLP